MPFYGFILGILCVWRITHLLQAEDGPGDIFVHLRRRAGEGFWGRLLDCFYCLSLWTAAPFAYLLGSGWEERFLLWPALSAGAILLERTTHHDHHIPSAEYTEDKEDDHVMLRQTETTVIRDNSSEASGQ